MADFSSIVRALADRAEEVAIMLLGKPSYTSPHELRWGRRWSVSLRRSGSRRGLWFDHERSEGGDLLHLIARERNVGLGEAVGIARSEFAGVLHVRSAEIERKSRPEPTDDGSARAKAALAIWSQTAPIVGSLAEHYFTQHRGLDLTRLDIDHAIRWHAGMRAVIALMTDAVFGEAVGIHRTLLDASGAKIKRRMLGRQGVVRVSPDEAVTTSLGITEGVEDALAVLLSGWAPVWAATNAGAIAQLPVIAGVEALTIFADADDAGLQAATACCTRWGAAGPEVRVCKPASRHG